MAWQYNDFAKLSGAERIARLEMHIAEVEGRISEEVSSDGKSRSTSALEQKAARLWSLLNSLKAMPSNRRNGGFTAARYS